MHNFSKLIFALIITLATISCQEKTNPNTQTQGNQIDLSLYSQRDVPGSSWKYVTRNHPDGELMEEGFVNNGVKTGTWTSYYPDDGYMQTISTYSNGVLLGPYLQFNERGRLDKHSNYENNILTGQYAEFKNGRLVKKIQYKNGLINGYLREYDSRSRMIKETNYKNNVLHGNVTNFNEEGKAVLQYEYKNGEKISGGIIE